MKKKPISLWHFRNQIPWLLKYQIASKVVLTVGLWILGIFAKFLLGTIDRPAVTSGDLPFLLRSWQGWMLLLVGFGTLVLYSIIDIQAMIIMSRVILHGEPKKLRCIFKEAICSVKYLCQPRGVLVILYVSLLLPLLETALGINFLRDLRIPDFIVSFIYSRFIFRVAYLAIFALTGIVGAIYIFTFHFMILRKQMIKTAMKTARVFLMNNWKGILRYYSSFLVKSIAGLLVLVFLSLVLPLWILYSLSLSQEMTRLFMLWISLIGLVILAAGLAVLMSCHTLKLTVLFAFYNADERIVLPSPSKKMRNRMSIAVIGLIGTAGILAWGISQHFDVLFPKDSQTEIIAHRGGGTMAAENTLEGIQEAIDKNCFASEIDVQRTADGQYIIQHDDTFERLCGDKRRPDQMTLEQIRELSVINQFDPTAQTSRIATLEEVLDISKDRIYLYIELKGKTADKQMADEIYQMVEKKGMLDQCAFISLDYSLVSYVEKNYPKADTMYLLYYAFGNVDQLECDGFGLEAETATAENINKIHAAGKRVDVWTCNTNASISRFLLSNADGIITDEVVWAGEIKKFISGQDDLARVMGFLLSE